MEISARCLQKQSPETEKKKEQPEVKAAVAKLGDGGERFSMKEMIEFAPEFTQRCVPTAEPTTPIPGWTTFVYSRQTLSATLADKVCLHFVHFWRRARLHF